jgi:hypothetical protein
MNSDLKASIDRILGHIDMRIDEENIDCLIPTNPAIYEDEGIDRNVFIRALIHELQCLGLRIDGVAVVSIHRGFPVRRRRPMGNRRARVID